MLSKKYTFSSADSLKANKFILKPKNLHENKILSNAF